MTKLVVLPAAERYLKKIKDKALRRLFQEAIESILADPGIGEAKVADLKGLRCLDIYHHKTNYELAYHVVDLDAEDDRAQGDRAEEAGASNEPRQTEPVVAVVLAGTRENFYKELKRHWQP